MRRTALRFIPALAVMICSFMGSLARCDEPEAAPVILSKDAIPLSEADAKATAEKLEAEIPKDKRSESVRMFLSIANGEMMGPGEGWFSGARAQFDFASLVERWGPPDEGDFAVESLGDPEDLLARLDRNRDGRISEDDLDWSDNNP